MSKEKILASYTNKQKGYKKNTYYFIQHMEESDNITYIVRQKIGGTTNFVIASKDFTTAKARFSLRIKDLLFNLTV